MVNFKKKANKFRKIQKKTCKPIAIVMALIMLTTSIQFTSFFTVKAAQTPKITNVDTKTKNNVPIDFEVTDKRNENTKVFRKIDGTYEMVVYNEPVHYYNGNSWEEINNTFINDGVDEYANKANAFKIKIPKTIDDNKKIKISQEGYYLEWSFNNINKSDLNLIKSDEEDVVENVNQAVKYHNIFNYVDLEYILKGTQLKENLIINQYIDNFSFSFNIYAKNLNLIQDENYLYFTDSNDKTIFEFEPFYMYDTNGNISYDVNLNVIQNINNDYTISVTPNDEWLKNNNRVYPIVIDPSINPITTGIENHYTDDITFYKTNILKIGDVNDNRAYLQLYDENNLELKNIIENKVVTYASLELVEYNFNSNYCDDCQLSLREVNARTATSVPIYLDDITSNLSDSLLNKNIIDYINVDVDDVAPNGDPNSLYSFDITKVIHKWKDDSFNEIYFNGIVELRSEVPTAGSYVEFYSSLNDPDIVIENVLPTLKINYVDNTGLFDYWTYHSQDAGIAGVGYVNDYTGNLSFIHTDYVPVSELFSFGLHHVYNSSNSTVNIGYGNGWRINYNEWIELEETLDGKTNAKYLHADGGTTYYKAEENCSVFSINETPENVCYLSEDGSGDVIEQVDRNVNAFRHISENTIKIFVDDVEKYLEIIDIETNRRIRVDFDKVYKDKIDKVYSYYLDDNQVKVVDSEATFNYSLNGDIEKDLLQFIEIKRLDEQNNLTVAEAIVYLYDGYTNNLLEVQHAPKDIWNSWLTEEESVTIEKNLYKKMMQALTLESVRTYFMATPEADTTPPIDFIWEKTSADKIENRYIKEQYGWVDVNTDDPNYQAPGWYITPPSAPSGYRWYKTSNISYEWKEQHETTTETYTDTGVYIYQENKPSKSGYIYTDVGNVNAYYYKKQEIVSTKHSEQMDIFECDSLGGSYIWSTYTCIWYTSTYYDLTPSDSYYEAPKYAYPAPSSSGFYRWVKVTNIVPKTWNKWKESKITYTTTWNDTTTSTKWQFEEPAGADSTYRWVKTGGIKYYYILQKEWSPVSPQVDTWFESEEDTISIDDNYRWRKLTSTEDTRILYEYVKYVRNSNDYIDYEGQPKEWFSSDEVIDANTSVEQYYQWFIVNDVESRYFLNEQFENFNSENRIIFTYTPTTHKLSSVTSNYDNKIIYDYQGDRVNRIELKDNSGQQLISALDIKYELGKTTFTDYRGDSTYYTFDNYGHTINILDDYGNAIFYEYEDIFNGDGVDPNNPNYYLNHKIKNISQPQKTINNFIKNPSFVDDTNWTSISSYYNIISMGNFVYGYSGGILGNNSLLINKMTAGYDLYTKQDVILSKGTYNLSSFIKTVDIANGQGAFIRISYNDGNGIETYIIDTINDNTDWNIKQLTFTVDSDDVVVNVELGMLDATGMAYFDNVYLTKEITLNGLNLLENPSFEDGYGWDGASITSNGTITSDIYQDFLGKNAITIEGDTNSTQTVSQEIIKSGTADETFTFGGWAKGFVTPNNNYADKEFLIVVYTIKDSQLTGDSKVLHYNTNVSEWQYLMTSITTTTDYDKIIFEIRYMNENSVMFDGLQLKQEQLGTDYAYSTFGKLTEVDSPNVEGKTTIEYDPNDIDKIVSVTDGSGKITSIEYDLTNTKRITSISNNVKVSFEYNDNSGNIEKVIYGNQAGNWFSTSTTYAISGLFKDKVTDEYGNTIDFDFLFNGFLNKFTNSKGIVTNYEYDDYGRLIKVENIDSTSSTLYSQNEYVYIDRRLKEIKVNNFYYNFEYDNFGRIVNVKINDTTIMSYQYEQYTAENGVVYYTDRLESQNYGNENSIKFIYNDENQLTNIQFRSNDTVPYQDKFIYKYDQNGNLAKYIEILNDNTRNEYTYYYDSIGRLISVVDNNDRKVNYSYNEYGDMSNVHYIINNFDRTVSYNNDYTNDQYDKTTYSNIVKDYIYKDVVQDDLQRLDKIDIIIDGITTISQGFVYDDGSVNVSMGNASTRIKELTYNLSNGLSYSYTYDELGNIIQVVVKENSIIVEQYDYIYDELNQLKQEDILYTNTNDEEVKFTYVYSYDMYGNILSKKQYNYQLIDEANLLYTYSYGYETNGWNDQLINFNGKTIQYDANGNPTMIISDDNTSNYIELTWEGRQLVSYTVYENNIFKEQIIYNYNDQGIRVRKQVYSNIEKTNYTEYNYFLEGDKVIYEEINEYNNNILTITKGIYYTYDVDGTIISFIYDNNINDEISGVEYFFIRNLQDDITKIVDTTGIIVVEYKYDAWGNIISITDASGINLSEINPYRYRGYRYDEETNLYYLNSRYYNPEIGRFINADGLVGQTGDILGHNMFAYCMNNPIMMVDPSGYFALSLTLVGIISLPVLPVLAVVATVALVAFVVVNKDEIVDGIERIKEDAQNSSKKYTVYTLKDEDTNEIKYVGRVLTKNYKARMKYHYDDKGLVPSSRIDNLTKWQCRGIEQAGMLYFHTRKTDGEGGFNKINGIADRNPKRSIYEKAANYFKNQFENEWLNLFDKR